MRIHCHECSKPVSNEVPDDTVLRAVATCPECIEKQPDRAPVDVVAAVRRDRAQVWLCKRNANGSHAGLAGMWEYPGGKVEPGEELRAALVRELHEEFPGCTVQVGQVLDSVPAHHEGVEYRVTFFSVDLSDVKEHPEHDEVRWFSLSEACSVDHLPSGTVFNARHLAPLVGQPELMDPRTALQCAVWYFWNTDPQTQYEAYSGRRWEDVLSPYREELLARYKKGLVEWWDRLDGEHRHRWLRAAIEKYQAEARVLYELGL